MKKLLSFTLAIFFLMSLNIKAQQEDAKSKAILDAVSKKTKAYTTIKADFEYTLENKTDKSSVKQKGSIILKGNKFKLLIEGQTLINDGKTVWNYIKESNEVQINESVNDDNSITPSNLLTIWEKDFRNKFISEGVENGITVQIIDLVPKKTRSYYKIKLYIDKAKSQLVKAIIFEKEGKTHYYTLKNFVTNEAVSDSTFTFDKTKYPNVEVIDLR